MLVEARCLARECDLVDPYVQLQPAGALHQTSSASQVVTEVGSVVTYSCRWNEIFSFNMKSQHQVLQLAMYDRRPEPPDVLLGEGSLELQALTQARPVEVQCFTLRRGIGWGDRVRSALLHPREWRAHGWVKGGHNLVLKARGL